MHNIIVALISSLDAATTVLICCHLVYGKASVVCPYALRHPYMDSSVPIVPPQAYRSTKVSHPHGIPHDVSVMCAHE